MYKILANTIFLGKDILFLPECHSTNDIALHQIKHGKAREGSVVICDNQTQGRGQRGNSWETKSGMNLTFSLVLQPAFLDLREQFYLNMMVSNGIRNLLQQYIPDLKVKWPNDLVVPGVGKLGGILIENVVSSGGWEHAVVGIGLNVNQSSFSVSTACSLASVTGSQFELEEIFRLLIVYLEQSYLALKKNKLMEIKMEYLQHLYLIGHWGQFSASGDPFEGKITGIDPSGSLLIELEDGETKTFGLKEISFPKF
ncbi:MAG: biotin--[acetyl-CoA-carboxylase] ligase [Algoriphagus sp.]|jgi:BirA family biotin operon repressor/biotin-[acetyl-CoA-carboxylase] ligase|nr:biotin--[acetyl-CoA-carboxylase] ligase [Algoriphagus sp.]